MNPNESSYASNQPSTYSGDVNNLPQMQQIPVSVNGHHGHSRQYSEGVNVRPYPSRGMPQLSPAVYQIQSANEFQQRTAFPPQHPYQMQSDKQLPNVPMQQTLHSNPHQQPANLIPLNRPPPNGSGYGPPYPSNQAPMLVPISQQFGPMRPPYRPMPPIQQLPQNMNPQQMYISPQFQQYPRPTGPPRPFFRPIPPNGQAPQQGYPQFIPYIPPNQNQRPPTRPPLYPQQPIQNQQVYQQQNSLASQGPPPSYSSTPPTQPFVSHTTDDLIAEKPPTLKRIPSTPVLSTNDSEDTTPPNARIQVPVMPHLMATIPSIDRVKPENSESSVRKESSSASARSENHSESMPSHEGIEVNPANLTIDAELRKEIRRSIISSRDEKEYKPNYNDTIQEIVNAEETSDSKDSVSTSGTPTEETNKLQQFESPKPAPVPSPKAIPAQSPKIVSVQSPKTIPAQSPQTPPAQSPVVPVVFVDTPEAFLHKRSRSDLQVDSITTSSTPPMQPGLPQTNSPRQEEQPFASRTSTDSQRVPVPMPRPSPEILAQMNQRAQDSLSPPRDPQLRKIRSQQNPSQRRARESLIPSVMFDNAARAKFDNYVAGQSRLRHKTSRDTDISELSNEEDYENTNNEISQADDDISIMESDHSSTPNSPNVQDRMELAKFRAKRINPSNLGTSLAAARFIIENVQFCDSSQHKQLSEIAIKVLKKLSVHYQMPEAQFALAHLYISGIPGFSAKHTPDFVKAFALFSSASKKDHADAQYHVALCYEIGAGVGQSNNKALQHYRKAAISNHPGAMYRLGMALLHAELGQGKNPRDGIKWIKLSAKYADEKYPFGLYELALLHDTGVHNYVWRDYKFLVNSLTQAANLGYAPAQFKLGEAYEYGNFDVKVDPERAIYYYTLAAQSEHPEAMFELGGLYLTGAEDTNSGFVLVQSDDTAHEWVKRAADAGLPKAMFALGYFAEMGIGGLKSESRAKEWYTKAAENGDAKAVKKLYEMGIKVKPIVRKSSTGSTHGDKSPTSTGALFKWGQKDQSIAFAKLWKSVITPPPSQKSPFAFSEFEFDAEIQSEPSEPNTSTNDLTNETTASNNSQTTLVNQPKETKTEDAVKNRAERRRSLAANRMSLYNPAPNRASLYMQPSTDAISAFRELQELQKLQNKEIEEENKAKMVEEEKKSPSGLPALELPAFPLPPMPSFEDLKNPGSDTTLGEKGEIADDEQIVLVIPAPEGKKNADGEPVAAQFITIEAAILKQISEQEGQQVLQIPGENPDDPPTYVYLNPEDFVGLFNGESKELGKSGEDIPSDATIIRMSKKMLEEQMNEQFSTMIRLNADSGQHTRLLPELQYVDRNGQPVLDRSTSVLHHMQRSGSNRSVQTQLQRQRSESHSYGPSSSNYHNNSNVPPHLQRNESRSGNGNTPLHHSQSFSHLQRTESIASSRSAASTTNGPTRSNSKRGGNKIRSQASKSKEDENCKVM